MFYSTSFPIGYGNLGSITFDGDNYVISFCYGDITIPSAFINEILNRWGDGTILNLIRSNNVNIWFDNTNNTLNTDDSDGWGFSWSKKDFVNYLTKK